MNLDFALFHLKFCFVYITILYHVLDYFRHNRHVLLTSVVNTTSRLPVNLCFRKAVITAPIASSIAVTMPTNRKFVITAVSWRTVSELSSQRDTMTQKCISPCDYETETWIFNENVSLNNLTIAFPLTKCPICARSHLRVRKLEAWLAKMILY